MQVVSCTECLSRLLLGTYAQNFPNVGFEDAFVVGACRGLEALHRFAVGLIAKFEGGMVDGQQAGALEP